MKLTELAADLAKITSSLAIVGTAVVSSATFFWGDTINKYTSIPEQLSQYGDIMDSYGRQISRIQQDVQSLRTIPDIVEYDELVSHIKGPCKINESCEVTYRLKRTDQGLLCSQPVTESGQYKVRNHFGLEYPVQVENFDLIRATDEYITLNYSFRVPTAAQPGLAEFYVSLKYKDCPFVEPGGVVTENSFPLRFIIDD